MIAFMVWKDFINIIGLGVQERLTDHLTCNNCRFQKYCKEIETYKVSVGEDITIASPVCRVMLERISKKGRTWSIRNPYFDNIRRDCDGTGHT